MRVRISCAAGDCFSVPESTFRTDSLTVSTFSVDSLTVSTFSTDSLTVSTFRADSLTVSTFSADSLTVSVQPPCAITCINSCVHVKNPKHWQPYHCLDTRKYCTHWQEWVALLLRRLLCLTRNGQGSTKKKIKRERSVLTSYSVKCSTPVGYV